MSEPIILAPLDGTPCARSALPVARALANIFGASLRVIHVGSKARPLSEVAAQLDLERAGLGGWSIDARTGEPSVAIVDAAQALGARLIVMCTHTAEARPTALFGRTAFAILKAAPCPIVFVHPNQAFGTWRPHRILLPHDGSPAANAAVGPALEFARAGSELLVVQVGSTGASGPGERGSLTMPRYVDQPQHEWPIWRGELLDRLASVCPDGPVCASVYVRGGNPGSEIAQLAVEESADLILLAWKGDWAPERARTLKAIVCAAPCPIMIVRA